MKKLWTNHFPWLLAISIVVIFLTRNLWGTRAWIETHDGIFHLIRQEVFTNSLKQGYFPVRWAGTLDNGFGLPLFNFIYPGPYYLGLPLSLLGLSSKWVIKIVEIGLYLLGGLGIYTLFARKDKHYAGISSLIYLTTPYLLVNIFVRGALGEFMAISAIPWVLVALYDLIQKKTLHWYHPLAYFVLFLSHNFLSFLFLPIYLILVWRHRESWKPLLVSLLTSLALASFFVLPMVMERGLLSSVNAANFTYNFADHFVYPLQLIYSKWGIGHSYAGPSDGFSFMLGFSQLLVLVLGTIIAFTKRRKVDLLIWVSLALAVIFFMLPISLPLWRLFSPMQIVQFPWRLLSLTTVIIPIISFYLLSSFKKSSKLLLSTGIILAISLYLAYRYTTPFYFQNNDQLATQLYIHRDRTTTSSRAEILPRWASSAERWLSDQQVKIKSGNANLVITSISPTTISFTSNTQDSSTEYLIERNYFPMWKVSDEKRNQLKVYPSENGTLLIRPNLGNHTYIAYIGSTMIESISNLLSILALFYLLSLIIRLKFKKYLDDHFQDWDISIALRYMPIVDELRLRTRSSDKILEVGSEIRGITTYYPRKVTGLDQGFDYKRQNKYLEPVEGSATKMPFKDESFDYVISVDCIEHITGNLRKKAIEEMLRVAKKKVYLTFPVGEYSQSIDKMLDAYFYKRNGEHFNYLTEHVENGLPNFDFVPSIVAKHSQWNCVVKGNTSSWLWVALLKMGFSNVQWQTSIYRRLLLFLPILKHFNFSPCYRQLYVLTRDKQ